MKLRKSFFTISFSLFLFLMLSTHVYAEKEFYAEPSLSKSANSGVNIGATQPCIDCHLDTERKCDGCHAHGAHSNDKKNDININAATDLPTYTVGDTITYTVSGGYRGGVVKATIYDINKIAIATTIGPSPLTLTTTANATGTFMYTAGWYGHIFEENLDAGNGIEGVFGINWRIDPDNLDQNNNAFHGEEIISIGSFVVEEAAVPLPPDTTPPSDATPPSDTTPPPADTGSENSKAKTSTGTFGWEILLLCTLLLFRRRRS